MSVSRRSVVVVLVALTAVSARAEQRVLVLDPAASKVSFTLGATGHAVEGRVAVKSGRIAFDPTTGAASGEIVIDLKSAETGNKTRDKEMHADVLETRRFPFAVFRAEKLRGTLAPSGSSQVFLDGTLSFHGRNHKMSLPAKVDVQGRRLTAEAQFPIPYVEWGLHDPSVIMLRVAKVVEVKVKAVARLQTTEAPAGK